MLVKHVSRRLQDRNWRLAVAESATGGLLGHRITQVPGSSDYFWGGVIAYADDVKRALLGVRGETLENWGAVSTQAALEMAQGICRATGAEVGISVTGIAGPTGATAYKPIGLYYIGLAVPGESWCWRHHFAGTRQENNEEAAESALRHLLNYLK
ncbi:MAG: CinA family protein [Anaerolineae bacterium]